LKNIKIFKETIILLAFIFISFFAFAAESNVDQKKPEKMKQPALSITGFADVLYKINHNEKAEIGLGSFEIDLEAKLNKTVSFSGAVASDGTKVSVAAGIFSMQLVKNDAMELGINFGKFDVPFGYTPSFYPSINNKLISSALANENTINGWNNGGLYLEGKTGSLNVILFAVDGAIAGVAVDPRSAFGLTVKCEKENVFSAGASFAYDMLPMENKLYFTSIFATLNISFLEIEIEAISKSATDILSNYDLGLFVQLSFNLSKPTGFPLMFTFRYGLFTPDLGEELSRITVGVTYTIMENYFFRLVYEINKESVTEIDNNAIYFQVAGKY